ncbi:MAG TPA: glycosyltransferase [Anaerolineales bacterium]|nr:glycosyltransferase [Anaerolineales bacterium]
MNIALLSEKYTPDIGGLAISTERLARLLSSAGNKIRVFSPTLNLLPSEKRTLTHSGVSVTRFGVHKRVDDTLVDWFELIVSEHKHDPFDVLHAYFLTQAGFVATYSGKYLNVPSVVSIRGNDIERAAFDPSRFSHTLYALQNASAVTANASELVKKAKAFIDREIILIPNGVDTEHFKPMERNKILAETVGLKTLESDSSLSKVREQAPGVQIPIIGFVGELREKKGLKTLLSAYALINKKQPSALLIVGEVRPGEDKQVFDEFQILHPNSQIAVTGYISPKDLPAYFSLIDVFVHPSLRDGMPNAVLEVMACEKAAVATSVGGVSDVIKDSENGLTVPANDAESLSTAILELLNDQALRVRLGRSARETIQKDFTLQKELNANLNVYKSLGINP